MHYEKPQVMDLSARARATGQDPLSCMNGNTPLGYEQVCGAGTSPKFNAACSLGGDTGDCAAGTSAAFTCLSGPSTILGSECSSGIGGSTGDCTFGESLGNPNP
jgi:hypothetical protein